VADGKLSKINKDKGKDGLLVDSAPKSAVL
jgi:hypothetical protein